MSEKTHCETAAFTPLTMKYVDKTTGKPVELDESKSEFLVLMRETEGEALSDVLNTRIFSVTRSTNDDGVLLLHLRSDGESENSIRKAITRLQENPGVEQVVPAAIDSEGQTRFMLPNVVTVQVESGKGAAFVRSLGRLNSKVSRRFRSPDFFEVTVPEGQAIDAFIAQLNSDPRVIFAEPSYYGVSDQELQVSVSVTIPATGDGEAVTPEWNVERVTAPAAWEVTRGSADIILAIIDGMPEVDHPALAGKFVIPEDNSNVFSADTSISSHATSIAGIIAGAGRITGIAPDVTLFPVVVNLNSQSYGERADAIRYVAEVARRKRIGERLISRVVMSCSWRTRGDVAAVRLAIREAVEAGVLAVFSAGNESTDTAHYPSDYAAASDNALGSGVISVAATDSSDRRAEYSNYSSRVSLCAPGGDGLPIDERDILCADLDGTFAYAAGTSIAAPHVSAIAALLLSVDPKLSPSDSKTLLLETAEDIRNQNPMFQNTLGTGRVNAVQALTRLGQPGGNTGGDSGGDTGSDTGGPIGGPIVRPPDPPDEGATGFPAVAISTTVPITDINLILATLRATQLELQNKTGWSLASAELHKNDQTTAFDLLSET